MRPPRIRCILIPVALASGLAACTGGGSASDLPDARVDRGSIDAAAPDAAGTSIDAAAPDAAGTLIDAGPAIAPMVIATSPADHRTSIDPGVTLEASFSRDMAADTLDATTFLVTLDGTSVAGTVSYTAATRVATFRPEAGLALLGPYTATVTTGATDLAGTPLAADISWSFTVRDGQWGAAIDSHNAGAAWFPQVAMDPSGNATAVWRQGAYNPQGNDGNIWGNRFVPGTGWGTAVLLQIDGAYGTGFPQVAVDAFGNATAVWEQDDGTRYNIWASRFVPGTGWGTATLLETDDAGGAYAPQLAVDPSGNATVVWIQDDGTRYDVWVNRFVPGTGWGTATRLETDAAGGPAGPQVAVDSSGNVTVVWHQSDANGTTENIWARRFVPSSGWDAATLLETDNAGDAWSPQVAVDLSGNAIVVWVQSDGTRSNIWANRFVLGSGWGTATLLETDDAGDARGPQVAVDPSGNATAVWEQSDGTWYHIWTSRFAPSSNWGPAMQLQTDNVAFGPQVAVDVSGNVLAVWQQFDVTDSNIWGNRFVPGAGWGTATLLQTDNAGGAYYPQVAVDASGNAIAVWQQFGTTGDRIWANFFR